MSLSKQFLGKKRLKSSLFLGFLYKDYVVTGLLKRLGCFQDAFPVSKRPLKVYEKFWDFYPRDMGYFKPYMYKEY